MWILAASVAVGLSLGIFGAGGAILTVPVLIYMAGMTPKMAVVSSLLVVSVISTIGSLPNLKRGHIHWPTVLWFGPIGIIGALCGAHLSQWVSQDVQMLTFAAVVMIASVMMWTTSASSPANQAPLNSKTGFIGGALVGALTGFVGVGGGFLLLPILMRIARLSFVSAAATSLVIIVLQAGVGLAKHLYQLAPFGQVFDWAVLLPIITAGSAGCLLGPMLKAKLPATGLKKFYASMLTVISISFFLRSFSLLGV